MDKLNENIFEYKNSHIFYFILAILISFVVTAFVVMIRANFIENETKWLVPFSFISVLLIFGTILIMAIVTYLMSHENDINNIFIVAFSFLFLLSFATIVIPELTYVIGILIGTPAFIMTYKPYLVIINNSQVEFYSFSKKDKKVVLAWDMLKELYFLHSLNAVSIEIKTTDRVYHYFLNRIEGEQVVNRLVNGVEPYEIRITHKQKGEV